MRMLTVLSLPPQLVFPDSGEKACQGQALQIFCSECQRRRGKRFYHIDTSWAIAERIIK
jgi:hypothetical protein